MIGPVLYLELLMGSRRGRLLFLRRIYAGWLILQFTFFFFLYLYDVWLSMLPPPREMGRMDVFASSRFAESYLTAFVIQQFGLLFLLTPAFVAGTLTDEKSRGTLQHLLTTDLSAWQIVIGKYLGRMAQLGLLALPGLPLLCLMAPFAGLDLVTIAALAFVALLPLFAVGAASILTSVWARQTRDAVLGLYAAGGVAYLLFWGLGELGLYIGALTPSGTLLNDVAGLIARLNDLFLYLDPLYVIEPAWAAQQDLALLGQRLATALVLWSSVSVACLGLAVWRLRRAYIRQLENAGGRKRTARGRVRRHADVEESILWKDIKEIAPLPADADEPIRWKESQIEGIAPFPILRRIPRPVALAATVLLTALVSANLKFSETQTIVFVLVASSVVGIRCSGAISGERERQTWEALLLTPLPVRELVREKLHGILNAARPYLIAYGVSATAVILYSADWPFLVVLVTAPTGPRSFGAGAGWVEFGWMALSFLAVWPAMYFVGAVGVNCSVRSASSWKSLLATLGIGYVGGLAICTMSLLLVGCGGACLLGLLSLFGVVPRSEEVLVFLLLLGTVIGWGIILWRFGGGLLVDAQRLIVGRERTHIGKPASTAAGRSSSN